MTINLNQQPIELKEQSTLFDLLMQLNMTEQKGIAVAVNQTVISKSKWNETILLLNDNITLIKAAQGG